MHLNMMNSCNRISEKEAVVNFPVLGKSIFRHGSISGTISEKGTLAKGKISPNYYKKYVKDPFTTFIDFSWRMLIFVYTLSFLVTWFLFGVLWWSIAYIHGDTYNSTYKKTGLVPCVTEMNDFISSFLFSIETQTTIGYGTRTPNTEYPEALFLISVQSIFGMLLQSIVIGVVYAKLSRPKTRGASVIFSQKAVISSINGKQYLMFRLGDQRKSHLVGCKLRAWLVQSMVTKEGVLLPNYVRKLKLSVDDAGPHFFLLWPVIATHEIDSASPFFWHGL